MKIYVSYRTYNSFGGHKSISIVADILTMDKLDFGGAIDELEITLHFTQDGPPRKSLEQSYYNFHENLKSLPKCTFYRKKKRLTLEIVGTFTTGLEIRKESKPPIVINPEWAESSLKDIIQNIIVIKSKFKKSDDFRVSDFLNYLESKLANFPSSVDELESIKETIEKRKKEIHDKLDDWGKLGVNWDDYHPSAKDIVSYPFMWNSSDDFAPNGNDTGADTLELFRKWNKRNKDKSPTIFFKKLMHDWEVEAVSQKFHEDNYSAHTYFQSIVGLAFASAKLRGECEPYIKDEANLAIEKYLVWIENETHWQYKDECKTKLNKAKAVIKDMPNKSKLSNSKAL